MKKFNKGDKVQWNASQGKLTGTVQKTISSDTTLSGNNFKASSEHPKIKVKSDKTGKNAIHKPESLKKK